ncbi:MAG: LacI family DNA-binding transcriptional regulator [Gammaproteobacteria bacterium]
MAARAGVGVGTVSRVLNQSPRVAAATRERVLRAIDELGFRPSQTARRLSLGQTQTLGVIAPFFAQSSVVERLRGVDDVIGGSAYDLTIFNVHTAEQRLHAFQRFARRDRLDGLLVISIPLSEGEIDTLERADLPVVLVDVAHPRLPHVATDDVLGGRLVAQYLLAAGHRRIAFVGYPAENPLGMLSTSRRLRGLRAALRSAGVRLSEANVKRGSVGRGGARRLTDELLALPRAPTAIFADSDVQAFGVISAVEAAGLSVPRDLSVIGFDDIELAGALGLTTLRQPLRASGERGAELLLREIEGGHQDALEPLPALTVVERRTVGPPPS